MQNISIQEQFINDAGKRLANEIDFGILCSFLEEIGWTKIILKPMDTETSNAIDLWTSKLKGNFENMGLVWIFEDQGDAVNFTLKYGQS